jgi:hypothetical protein
MAHWETIDGSVDDDVLVLPLDRFCNRMLAWFQTRMKQSDYDSWLMRLQTPPPKALASAGEWSDEETMAAFQAFSEPARG